MKRRLFSMLLTFCMTLTLIPSMTARATELDPEPELASDSQPTAQAATIVASGECGADGDNLTWTLDNTRTLTISGSGEMEDYIYIPGPILVVPPAEMPPESPWTGLRDNINTVVIEGDVTSIGNYAFNHFYSLETVEISDHVSRIGEAAFSSSNLKTVKISDHVNKIESHAFSFCSALKTMTLPMTLTTVESYTFSHCVNLYSITIPASVTHIELSAFNKCGRLRNVYYSGSMDDWKKIQIDSNNASLLKSTVYCTDGNVTDKSFTITLDANGGNIYGSDTTDSMSTGTGGKLSYLPTPTRDGYTFDGWYTSQSGGDKITTSTVFTENTTTYGNATIYAHWVPAGTADKIYTVSFNANGGTVSLSKTQTESYGRLLYLPIPARTDYTFNGWYTAETSGEKITEATVFDKDTTVYAHWTKFIKYTPELPEESVSVNGSADAVAITVTLPTEKIPEVTSVKHVLCAFGDDLSSGPALEYKGSEVVNGPVSVKSTGKDYREVKIFTLDDQWRPVCKPKIVQIRTSDRN